MRISSSATIRRSPPFRAISRRRRAGGRSFPLTGTNFGTSLTNVSVLIGGTSATVTSVNNIGLTFTAPPGTGTSKSIVVTIAGQSVTAPAGLNYDPPTFLAIKNNHGSTGGGTLVTIAGADFGSSTATVSVLVGGQSAIVSSIVNNVTATFDSTGTLPGYGIHGTPNSTIMFSELTFAAPAGEGIGKSIAVKVDGQSLSTSATFSYDPPQVLSVTPSTGTSLGGTQVTIQGIDFGSDPTVNIGSIKADFVRLSDIVVGSTPEQQLVVTTEAGGGSNLSVSLDVGSQFSAGNPSATFSYVPTITSNGGGATGSVSVAEDTTAATTVVAADGGVRLTYSIAGGADAARFQISPITGLLSFVAPPDFENPTDAGGDNVYNVIVQASDGTESVTQALAVSVTDVTASSSTVYVNSAWANDTTGTTISFADPGGIGTDTATFGVNAFATIQGGVEAIQPGHDLVVFSGSYPQPVTLTQAQSLLIPGGASVTIAGRPSPDRAASSRPAPARSR